MMHGCRQVHLLKQRKSVPYCIGYSLRNLASNRTAELYISSNTYVVFYFIETKLFLIYRLENQRMMANTLSTDRLQEKEWVVISLELIQETIQRHASGTPRKSTVSLYYPMNCPCWKNSCQITYSRIYKDRRILLNIFQTFSRISQIPSNTGLMFLFYIPQAHLKSEINYNWERVMHSDRTLSQSRKKQKSGLFFHNDNSIGNKFKKVKISSFPHSLPTAVTYWWVLTIVNCSSVNVQSTAHATELV